MRTLSADRARRLVLGAQGLARPRPRTGGRGPADLAAVLERLDVVQLDAVNVLARAHELPFWSRLGPHDRVERDRWLWQDASTHEAWIHQASVGPVDLWPLLRHRRARLGAGANATLAALARDRPELIARVLDEVRTRGPITIKDLTDPGTRTGPWWGLPEGRLALDHLALGGAIAVHHRTPAFVTAFDATERVIPDRVRDVEVSEEEAREALVLRAARAQGVGTAADLADHHRQRIGPVRAAIARLVAAGRLVEVRVTGWGEEPAYLRPDATAARTTAAATLVSPFDPLVWHRDRTERLFGFRYRIELYVPAARRVHGYYVLPFLLGDRLVARVDLAADRRGRRLLVPGAFAEPGVDRVAVADALARELVALGAWLGLDAVVPAANGDLAPRLRTALGRLG